MNIDFAYYRSIFWRRFPYFMAVFAITTSIGLAVALILPPQYEAQATLLVESAQIPDELASSTVRTVATEQLQIIEQRLMTRANLIDTAERLGVYARERDEPVRASDIVDDMRERTTFNAASGRNQATLLTISFRAEDAQTSAKVTNEFVTLVLQENVEMRTNVAGQTLEFFEQEVTRLGAELDFQSTEIIKFTQDAGQALPDNQELLMDRQQILQERMSRIDFELGQLEDQKARLVELFETGGTIDDGALTPQQQALNAARSELDAARLVYAENAPQLRLLRARISMLEQRVQEEAIGAAAAPVDPATDFADARVQSQVAELDARMAALRDESATLADEIVDVDAVLARIPANALALRALEREHDNLQSQYLRAVDRLSQAETGERIELLSKGQRITIIEQATPPDRPTAPNRILISSAGAMAGLMFGLGFVVLLEVLNRSIRRPAEIVDRLGITPLAVLPYVKTGSEVAWRRTWIVLILCAFIIAIPLAVYLVHTTVMPLDGYANRILQNFGVVLPVGL